jgi:hypothetical protein
MDRSEVKAIVEREIEPLLRKVGIAHWKIRFSYQNESVDADGCLKHGECTRLVDYNVAHISLNPESFDDEDAVLRTLRHELFHVVLSPFDLYSSSVDQATSGTDLDVARGMLERVWNHACEKAVINLERMFFGLTSESV